MIRLLFLILSHVISSVSPQDIIYNQKCFQTGESRRNPDVLTNAYTKSNDCIIRKIRERIISPKLHIEGEVSEPHPLPSEFFSVNPLVMLNIGGVQPSEHWINVNAQVHVL